MEQPIDLYFSKFHLARENFSVRNAQSNFQGFFGKFFWGISFFQFVLEFLQKNNNNAQSKR
jgi:hypothetical protein